MCVLQSSYLICYGQQIELFMFLPNTGTSSQINCEYEFKTFCSAIKWQCNGKSGLTCTYVRYIGIRNLVFPFVLYSQSYVFALLTQPKRHTLIHL